MLSAVTRTLPFACLLLLCAPMTVVGDDVPPANELNLGPPEFSRMFLKAYCIMCHGGDEPEAELSLEIDDTYSVVEHRDIWSNVLEMVRLNEMPPEDQPQPPAKEAEQFLQWVETELARFDCAEFARPGRVTIRRLNRAEYNNTVRDLVGIDFQPADTFPADDVGHGFDNIADVLSLPPLLMEKYLEAAEQILESAINNDEVFGHLVPRIPKPGESGEELARRYIRDFSRRAFRRPPSQEEVDRLVQLYQRAKSSGEDFKSSMSFALQAALVSPRFLFRVELDNEQEPNQSKRLDGYELASRLSYFLWSSMPDETLFQAAESGTLQSDEGLIEQTNRMLADDKSSALVDNFFDQWLQLRQLAKLNPDPELFPAYNAHLREAMLEETRQFVRYIIREDRNILEFLDCDYTFANGLLSRHYGLEGVDGEAFQKVSLVGTPRGGVFTQGSILTLTSNPTRTSPVKRGKWILENILGSPPPPPPPGVPELDEDSQAELLGSLRERMQQHRTNPSCSVCHRSMDALGFGFENFDAIGAWRDRDGRFEIDPSGELPGKLEFNGPAELRNILKSTRTVQFTRCFAEKMLTYALGRGLEPYDRCTVDDIVEAAETNDYRLSSVMAAIVTSDAFRVRESLEESK